MKRLAVGVPLVMFIFALAPRAARAEVFEVIDSAAALELGGASNRTELAKTISFTINDHSPYADADGSQGASGRVLLMNRDVGDATHPAVDYQGYYDSATRSTNSLTFWEFLNDDAAPGYNLKAGSEFVLWTANFGSRLWHLVDCRQGNTFPLSNTDPLLGSQNYLNWSSTSKRITAHNALPIRRGDVGQCVMRNTLNASVYSSCFTNGIGTIYFDAVNGWNNNVANNYGISVQIATNCVDGTGAVLNLPPTDENVVDVVTNIDVGAGTMTISTNLYGKANWQNATLRPLLRDGTTNFVAQAAAMNLDLRVMNGGTVSNFYRVYVPLNYQGPARFRIVRTSIDGSKAADGGALILLDNIIASYPSMRADLASYGRLDESRSGKQTLGQENAWLVPFPSASDTNLVARARPEYSVNPGTTADTNAFVAAAKMYYRWRYLNQRLEAWKSVSFDPDTFTAIRPLELPGLPGDVEFWYELHLNAPFYRYVDYSGLGLGVPGYSEEIAFVTNRRDSASARLQSSGTDWFVRLREGVSVYEGAELLVKRGEGAAVTAIPLELIGNNIWRGYLKTLTNDTSTAYYRIRFANKQEAGSTAFAENEELLYTTDGDSIPVSGTLRAAGADDWSAIGVDATTGYLMFQVDETTRSITIVHADYQNFNAWSDAKGVKFVGSSEEDEKKSGTSPVKRDYGEDFDTWKSMSATNSNWCVPTLKDLGQLLGREAYKTFASDLQNNWSIGQGMWVGRYYADTSANAKNKGVAIQMEGQGRGYLQYTDKDAAPRGLESISFNARLGQFIKFEDFSYYDCGQKGSFTNYTFVTRSAFDFNENKNFSGNASLSLAAYYRPGVGCYEARWEQLSAEWNPNGTVKGPLNKGTASHRLSLYRWRAQADGVMKATMLCAWTNNTAFEQVKATGIASPLMPFFITAKTVGSTTFVMAGVKEVGITVTTLNANVDLSANANWNVVACADNDASARLTGGTYGVVAANCQGAFGAPVTYSVPLAFNAGLAAGDRKAFADQTLSFPSAANLFHECFRDLRADEWVHQPGRMAYDNSSTDSQCKISASPVNQTLEIYTAPAGSQDWKLLTTAGLDSFGSAGSSGEFTFNLYTTADSSVRIKAAGTVENARTDIVIDSVVLKQWRGNNYSDADEMVPLIPNWEDPSNYKAHTNFTFTGAWITNSMAATTNGMLLLSAKRTTPDAPSGIRSPLMDGAYGRGKGLGMFSFTYRNAQANARLLLQVATNVTYNTVNNYDIIDTNAWTTVTNFTFAGLSPSALSFGTRSCYIGLHDVQGVMRLIVDPALVAAVSNVTDRANFGEILIDEVFCRDEPALDNSSWWGWNIRSVGTDAWGADGEKKMYLPDLTTDPYEVGLSMALNNSIVADTDPEDAETYKQHKPFVQTPTFTSNVVGEVTFRARKYDAASAQPASVTLYGSLTGDEHGDWADLHTFVVSNATYAVYSYKTDPGQAYNAFRLAVTGVDGVSGAHDSMGPVRPDGYDTPVRVLIEEVLVSEAVRARIAFRNVGAFRSALRSRDFVPNVPSRTEQPLCNEGWGIQAEVYAAQLADDINFDMAPQVYLWWYEGVAPWGYENWGKLKGAHRVRLPNATDTNLVYRSTYLNNFGDTVIPMSTAPGSVVQYTLEVQYWQKGSTVPMTNFLNGMEWRRPDWYSPVDYNADYGRGVSFAAYNILDTVAPGWAWVNEINIWGSYANYLNNSEADSQFVEIAVPQEADISGWSVRVLGASVFDDSIVTNSLGRFGTSILPGKKKDGGLYSASNMVFRVVSSRKSSTVNGGELDPKNGECDATWNFDVYSDTFDPSGEIFATDPVAIQLVRGSGIVEHEVLGIGTNFYGSMPGLEQYYDPSNTVAFLRQNLRETHVFYVGEDSAGEGKSLGVFASHGETSNVWNNVMGMTPGRINQNQSIDPDHPTPNGEMIIVYCDLGSGHIRQTVGEMVETNASTMVMIPRGSSRGTNIVYTVDPWYELKSVVTNRAGVAFEKLLSPARTYQATVGVGASNNVTVIATAGVQSSLLDYGLTDKNRYTPAVINWLENHKDMYGNDWANPESTEIQLADFIRPDDTVITNLNLTQMYWLDMDPTVSNLALKGYMSGAPVEHLVAGGSMTNLRVRASLMITNRTSGAAWRPYVLRGLAPGENSWAYGDANASWAWTAVTFKVVGILMNGKTSYYQQNNWVPLRWFVFKDGSFCDAADFAADPAKLPYSTAIEFVDPYSRQSPGYTAGRWADWVRDHGWVPINYFWCLDDRMQPVNVEVLEKENFYAD